ncbi:zinc-finger homeodomain protein 11-like [Jatropha curcas]|uniref:zinc-finger homeodomain protein 11-like n=1 Tax=Jatropha curcas TaxID=180498 RepID=UPI001893668C|nr:zinc-finger homeodomain protein 11-like [Jatropha curcas]
MAKNPFVFPSTFSDSQSPRQSSSSSPSLSFDSYSSSSSDPSVNSPFLSSHHQTSHHQSLSLQLSQTSSSRSCLPSAAFLGSCAAHKILRRPCNDKCYSASYFPPPISSSYPSAPHMLLALSGGVAAGLNENSNINVSGGVSARKRFRTKFSQDQKEIMYQFAERVGWKMQKRDEELIQEFCNEVGVDKGVLKVWMHNNKNTNTFRQERR